jgi:hypothetical protein
MPYSFDEERLEILRELDEDFDPMADPDNDDIYDDDEYGDEDDNGAIREEEDDDYNIDGDEDDSDDDEQEDLPFDDDDIDDYFERDGSLTEKAEVFLGNLDRAGLLV